MTKSREGVLLNICVQNDLDWDMPLYGKGDPVHAIIMELLSRSS